MCFLAVSCCARKLTHSYRERGRARKNREIERDRAVLRRKGRRQDDEYGSIYIYIYLYVYIEDL